MSWFSSLAGGFASGYGFEGLGKWMASESVKTKNPLTGAYGTQQIFQPNSWYEAGQTLGQMSGRGGGSGFQFTSPNIPGASAQPARPVKLSLDIPTPTKPKKGPGGFGEGQWGGF